MRKIILAFVLLFTISSYAQFKKVDTYTVSNGTTITAGDAFEIGEGSGQNETYLYINVKPDLTGHTVYPMKKGHLGRKFTVELIRELKNPIGDFRGATIIFKNGKTRYLIDIENAIRTKEVILL
jgi:hypothetical protein